MIVAKNTGGMEEFERCPEGSHQAVVSNVYDIGMQKKMNMQGNEEIVHQIVILFELEERFKTGKFAGERFVVSRIYKLSFHPKSNLRVDTQAILSRKFSDQEAEEGYDVEQLRGKNCLISIAHSVRNGKTYSDIVGIMAKPNGMTAIKAELLPEYKPEWIAKKASSQVYQVPPVPTHKEPKTEVKKEAQEDHSSVEMKAQLKKWVNEGLITYPELTNIIIGVVGKAVNVNMLEDFDLIEVFYQVSNSAGG